MIEYAPDSKQADEYRQLASKIHNNSGKGTIPTPITMEELEQMLLDFGIMKTEEQQLAELAAKEAKLATAHGWTDAISTFGPGRRGRVLPWTRTRSEP